MTEVAQRSDRAHYEADLQKALELAGPDWLRDIRASGSARFADLEFPHHKQEDWRFTNIQPIVRTEFPSILGAPVKPVSRDDVAPYLYDEPEWAQFVFVDGVYDADLSHTAALPGGIRTGSLAEAVAANDPAVKEHLDQHVEAKNAYIALNAGFVYDGAFLHVPAKVTHEIPIHFVFVSTSAQTAAAHPRNLFVIDPSSEATVVETFVGLEDDLPYFTNLVEEVVIGDNATLHRYKIVEEGDHGYHLATAKIVQGRDANLESFSMSLTGKIVRNELDVVLKGEGGQAVMNGLYLNDADRLIDNFLHVTHASPKCYSRMGSKGVLDDTSSSVFTGKVLVPQGSQQTDSDQLNNNLLLSDRATIDTKPQLEIFADDVKCTHGATIGGFPHELIFYFQTRGMTAAMAHAILTFGFATEVVDEMGIDAVRARLSKYVFDKYSPR